jgi:hypothetical protein
MRFAAAVALAAVTFTSAAQAQIERVTIAGRAVEHPAAFAELLGDLDRAEPAPSEARRIEIVVRRSGSSGAESIAYFPLEEVLRRDGEWFEATDELANRIEEELEARAAEGRSDWLGYLSLFFVLGAGGTILWLMWVRRRWRAHAT